MTTGVAPAQRFTSRNLCPICGGHKDLPQGRGVRCYGFMSDDQQYAHCTREEHAGNLDPHHDGTFVHRLVGDCNCGTRHDNSAPTPKAPKRDRGPVVRTIEYEARDPDGSLAAFHVRREYANGDKDFAWKQPDGTWGLNGRKSTAMPLYGIDRVERVDYVVVVEGEKAQEALTALRIAAVGTMTGAAAIPDDAVLATIIDKRVILWPDNDQDGRRHMERIAERLSILGAEDVRLAEWPDAPSKGDAADFITAATTRADIKTFLRTAKPWTPQQPQPTEPAGPRLVIRPVTEYETRPVRWLWPGWLARGKVAIFAGVEGDGKSYVSADIVARLSRGSVMPDGSEAPPCRVLLLIAEDGIEDTTRPRLEWHGANMASIAILDAVEDKNERRMFSLRRHLAELHEAVIVNQFDVIVIDPLSSFLHQADRNSEGEVRDLLTPLVRLADETGVAILGIAHLNRPNGTNRRPTQRILGSTAFGAVSRLVWMLAPAGDDEDKNRRVLAVVKSNIGVKPPALEWSIPYEDAPVQWYGVSDRDINDLLNQSAAPKRTPERERILSLLQASPEPLGPADIAGMLDMSHGSVRKMLRDMLDAGDVTQPAYGQYMATVVTVHTGNSGNSIGADLAQELPELPELPLSSVTTVIVESPQPNECPKCGGTHFRRHAWKDAWVCSGVQCAYVIEEEATR